MHPFIWRHRLGEVGDHVRERTMNPKESTTSTTAFHRRRRRGDAVSQFNPLRMHTFIETISMTCHGRVLWGLRTKMGFG